MYAKRIIPCLDLKNGRVVKGTNFVGLRDAGDPVEAAVEYDRQGADELVLLDITASSDARNIMTDIVSRVAESIFIPLLWEVESARWRILRQFSVQGRIRCQ